MSDTQPQPDKAREPEEEPGDRRLANVVIGVGLVVLIGIMWWLSNALLEARRADDCMSSGRRNCTPIQTPAR